jgi:hypothetical protein
VSPWFIEQTKTGEKTSRQAQQRRFVVGSSKRLAPRGMAPQRHQSARRGGAR